MADTATAATTEAKTTITTAAPPEATEQHKAEASVDTSILGGAKAPDSKTDTAKTEPVKTDVKTQVAGAPETYTDFKMPEGVALDKALLDKALPMFKDLGLSQDAAQKLVSFQAENVKSEIDARLTDYNKTVEGWKQETMKSLGADYEKELGFAAKALDAYGSKELRQLLDQTGFGNNPLIAKMLVAVGKAMSEDAVVEGSRHAPSDPETDLKLAMFPSMKEQILAGRK